MEGGIIFLVIIIISVISRVIQAAAEKQKEGGAGGGARADKARGDDYSASPDDIRRFLDGLESPRVKKAPEPQPQQARAQQQARQPEPRPAPSMLAEDTSDMWESGSGADQGMPTGPVQEQPSSSASREKKRRAARRRALAARKKKKAQRSRRAAAAAQKTEPVRPGALDRGNLKQAVIWSEILGPPVSRRRRPGHRPPGPGR